MPMINIADLTDPKDIRKRTYREINLSTNHKLSIGDLVEMDSGVRLFIASLKRDCDGTPLYSLTPDFCSEIHGYADESLKKIDKPIPAEAV